MMKQLLYTPPIVNYTLETQVGFKLFGYLRKFLSGFATHTIRI